MYQGSGIIVQNVAQRCKMDRMMIGNYINLDADGSMKHG